ncbi:hypothetical protein Nepgr_006972 [Nepenthes gracilis]|uniref:Homeobox-leucine zipper protein n=1 Tax=Nepenthes gracilis TaxID=150966 RepID=A0AAD3S6U0_NEPGR|nr:hypothetical protein Nepgr_006972 [Nepenthes gracilis]
MVCGEMAFLPPPDFLFQNHDQDRHPSSASLNPQLFHGVPSLSMMKRSSSSSMSLSGYNENDHYYGCEEVENNHGEHDLSDDGSQVLGERKKRLNVEQVKTLEKNFELCNKLEPERKIQLAKALGLQPRQVSIWFQNRRARWKTKQLEKDYSLLKTQFEALKADNHSLQAHNKKLHAELLTLKSKETTDFGSINLKAGTKSYWSNGSTEISSDINLGTPGKDSSLPMDPSNKLHFPSSLMPTQLLQSSSQRDLHCPKVDQTIQGDSFCNMLGGHPALWPWPENHHQHHHHHLH